MVERSAVNRLVVGSNPTSGAIFCGRNINLVFVRMPRHGRLHSSFRPAPHCRDTLPISPCSAFKLSFECIYCPERKFGGGVHVCNARLQLQKILPCAILVSLRIGFVAHAEDHSQKAMAW